MQIAGFQKFTMVDYPGEIAATVFTRGCSFRCPFCHNPELVIPDKFSDLLDEDEILAFLEKRKNQLHAVCITGGEPTLQPDLQQFINKLKVMGYKIKLDSNGWDPNTLKKLIDSGQLDYIAMDIKATLDKYPMVAKFKGQRPKVKIEEEIQNSIKLIMDSGIPYEFRTTVVHPLHEVKDFEAIGKMIKGARRYFIQNFVQSKHNDESINFSSFSKSELEEAKNLVAPFVGLVEIR